MIGQTGFLRLARSDNAFFRSASGYILDGRQVACMKFSVLIEMPIQVAMIFLKSENSLSLVSVIIASYGIETTMFSTLNVNSYEEFKLRLKVFGINWHKSVIIIELKTAVGHISFQWI